MTDPAVARPDVGFRQLRTPHLVIRRFALEDAPAFAAYRSDPDVARYQSWDAPYSVDDARRFMVELAASHPDTPGKWYQFAITAVDGGALVGDLAAFCDANDPRLAMVGFTLATPAQGRGYATEALRALLRYLFEQRGKHRVAAGCDARNVRSAALMARVGMRREAHHLRNSWEKGAWTDEYVYAMLASEWAEAGSGTIT